MVATRKLSGWVPRPAAEHRHVDAVDRHRRQDPHIAPVERQVQQGLDRAVPGDGRDAEQRHQRRRRPARQWAVAEQGEGPHDDDQRPGRLQQQHVQRGGAGEADIRHRIVGRDAGCRQQQHHAPVAQQDGGVPPELGPGEADRDEERSGPAPVGQRDRRHVAGQASAKTMLPAQNRLARISSVQAEFHTRVIRCPCRGVGRRGNPRGDDLDAGERCVGRGAGWPSAGPGGSRPGGGGMRRVLGAGVLGSGTGPAPEGPFGNNRSIGAGRSFLCHGRSWPGHP